MSPRPAPASTVAGAIIQSANSKRYSVFLRRRSTIKPRNATARAAQMMRTIDGSIEISFLNVLAVELSSCQGPAVSWALNSLLNTVHHRDQFPYNLHRHRPDGDYEQRRQNAKK